MSVESGGTVEGTHGPTQRTLDMVNEFLATAEPMHAYCVGVVCALAWREGRQPSYAMLVLSASCSSVGEAWELWRRQTEEEV